jgi:phenylpropionate dioxygenase-like ring-hydroxylating dioxygenase large terminal subunit
MSESAASTSQSPDGQMLRGFWYAPLRGGQLRGAALRQALLLGVPLVLGRDSQGRAFAMRDTCPHRGMPLSAGRMVRDRLECPYHGWKFEGRTGQCREIPSLTGHEGLNVEKIYAGHFACDEADGYIWVFVPEPGMKSDPAEGPPRLPTFSERFRLAHLAADLPVSIDHGIIGLMDPAHGPFVHQAWWWRTRHSIHEKQKIFEPIPNGFRIRAHSPSANSAAYKLLGVYGQPITTTIEFILPNLRLEQIHCGDYWFSSRAMVVPVSTTACRLEFAAAWNVFRHVPFVTSILRAFGRRFIAQDTNTMALQAQGLKYNPPLMLIDDADRPAKWYFQLKQAWLDSRRSGQPMQHPIAGPVTLKWRS